MELFRSAVMKATDPSAAHMEAAARGLVLANSPIRLSDEDGREVVMRLRERPDTLAKLQSWLAEADQRKPSDFPLGTLLAFSEAHDGRWKHDS
jgi:hypothetical protein